MTSISTIHVNELNNDIKKSVNYARSYQNFGVKVQFSKHTTMSNESHQWEAVPLSEQGWRSSYS